MTQTMGNSYAFDIPGESGANELRFLSKAIQKPESRRLGHAKGHEPTNKGKRLPPEPLTASEVQRLLAVCSSRAPTGIRNRALVVALWRGMLRCSEALALFPKDIDLKIGTIRVLHGKGDKTRLVGIDPTAAAVIGRWLDVRYGRGLNGRTRLFCTLDGKPLSSPYVRGLLPRLGRKAGVEKRVHPHGLRHSGAVELANEGIPLHVVQRQLGHSNVATTSRYISHISADDVVKAMRSRNWDNT